MAGDGGGDRMPARATGSSARLEVGEGDDGHEDGWGRWSIRSKSEYRMIQSQVHVRIIKGSLVFF